MVKLALFGGEKIRENPFPHYNTIGDEEKRAVLEVLESTELSKFLAKWSPDYYGGPKVRQLERDWADYFQTHHAISVNSATSGLYAAVGAAGIGPGDEVIVSPYTMSASATAALVYGAIPIFADIDPEIFCITPESIEERISPYTKGIIVVDLFGHPADMDGIMQIAKDHDLIVIEDAAQAPGAIYKGRYAGTLADMGVYSLNYHKTIHCGEGGIIVTNNEELAERLRMIRNHAEGAVRAKGTSNIVNMIGFNYRMTEIEAAIAIEQLKKLERLLKPRIEAANFLTSRLRDIPGISPPLVRHAVKHGYYVYPIKYNADVVGISRERFVDALNAEGIPMVNGYTEPIYFEPLYQERIAYGSKGFPFTYPGYYGTVNYNHGICPITEQMYYRELMITNVCHANISLEDLEDVIAAIDKITNNLGELA